MSTPWLTVETYRCKACGAELFLTRKDAAEHLTECEKADPRMRQLAREWLEAGAPTIKPKRSRPRPRSEGEGA